MYGVVAASKSGDVVFCASLLVRGMPNQSSNP